MIHVRKTNVVLAFACPHCKMGAGVRCRTPIGRFIAMDGTHKPRLALAYAAGFTEQCPECVGPHPMSKAPWPNAVVSLVRKEPYRGHDEVYLADQAHALQLCDTKLYMHRSAYVVAKFLLACPLCGLKKSNPIPTRPEDFLTALVTPAVASARRLGNLRDACTAAGNEAQP